MNIKEFNQSLPELENNELNSSVIPIYYEPTGDVLQHAENNLPFFRQFVKEMGSARAHRYLWPGQVIFSIIHRLNTEWSNTSVSTVRARIVEATEQYYALYHHLTDSGRYV